MIIGNSTTWKGSSVYFFNYLVNNEEGYYDYEIIERKLAIIPCTSSPPDDGCKDKAHDDPRSICLHEDVHWSRANCEPAAKDLKDLITIQGCI